MKQLSLWLVTILVGGALLGCVAQQNSNSSGPTPSTQMTPTRSQASPQPSGGHDHAAETAVPRIGIMEAQAAADRGEAVFLDVRQMDAFRTGHIKGAIAMPEAEIVARAGTLPKDKKIITYCS